MKTAIAAIALLSRALSVLAGLATFLIMILIAADVTMRFLGSGVPGTLEIVTYYLMLIVAFLAIGRVEQRDGMISVDALYDGLPPGGRRWMMAFAALVTAAVFAGIAWVSLLEALKQYRVGAYAETLTFSILIWPAWFIVPVAFATGALTAAARCVLALAYPRVPPDLRQEMGLGSVEGHPDPDPGRSAL